MTASAIRMRSQRLRPAFDGGERNQRDSQNGTDDDNRFDH